MKTKLTGIRMNISFIYHHHLKESGRHNFIGKFVWHLLYSTCVTKTNPKHSDPYSRNSRDLLAVNRTKNIIIPSALSEVFSISNSKVEMYK